MPGQRLKKTILYIAILLSLPAYGQFSYYPDTIKIKEVIISRQRDDLSVPGFKNVNVDSSVISNQSHGTLADLLKDNSSIFIKSYGMGGTASVSFRGTGANHTQIAWNDININHPMLGQSDLSLIPAGFIDEIQISFGGSSLGINSGGIGGIINLKTKPLWKKETQITFNPGIGSYDSYTGLIKVRSGNSNFQSVTKAFLHSSQNDFRYLNTQGSSIPVWETRINNDVRQKGLIQELHFRNMNKEFSARLWYQSANREIPSSILSQQMNVIENQFDESFRTMVNFNLDRKNITYYATGSLMLNRLDYKNTLASIDSRNLSHVLIFKSGIEKRTGGNTILKFYFTEELSVVKSNNYLQNETRNNFSVTASVLSNLSDRISASILIREIVDENSLLVPDFAAGIQYRLMESKEYFLKSNISRNSRIPSMNDLFWSPGGNSNLKNEYSYSYEAGYEMKQQLNASVNLHYDITVFQNIINDMIQWHPGDYSYWTADNIQKVNTGGLESSLSLAYKINKFSSQLVVGYSYTEATMVSSYGNSDVNTRNQLMYIPANLLNTSIKVNYNNLYLIWVSNLVDRRYITVDNSRYLPHYYINNTISGIKFNIGENILDINFSINNLFNISYQSIAYYPQPGRSYSLKMLFQISK